MMQMAFIDWTVLQNWRAKREGGRKERVEEVRALVLEGMPSKSLRRRWWWMRTRRRKTITTLEISLTTTMMATTGMTTEEMLFTERSFN